MYNKNTIGFNAHAKVDAEGDAIPFVLQQLMIRPLNRKSQDIASMLSAIRTAEGMNPRYTYLFDLCQDFLTTDAHLRSVYDKKIMGVTNVPWIYTNADGSENPAMTEWIDSPDFELVISEVIKSKAWFYSMLEFVFYSDGTFRVVLIPRKHMRPKLGIVTFEQTGDEGIYVREGIYADTILEAGDENELGLLAVAAQYVIFKRCALTDWAEFAEVFGRPIIDAVWDGFDEDQKIALTQALDTMGGGGQLIRPAGTTVTLLPGATNNPTGELFKGIYDVCNAEISKLFVGQTETTESSDSSGYAQAAVHAGTENDINANDINFVRRLLNRRVHKILEVNTTLVSPGGMFSVKDNSAQISKTEQIAIDKTLKNEIGLPMDDDHFYKTYGVEKPADYEAQKEAFAKKGEPAMSPGFEMALKKTFLQLRDEGFFLKAPKANGAKTISLKDFYSVESCCKLKHKKGWIKLADGGLFNEAMVKQIFEGALGANQISGDYYFSIAKVLTNGIMKGMKIGSSLAAHDAKTRLFESYRHNIYAFSAAKNMTAIQEFNKQLKDEQGNDRSYNQFRKAVIPVDKEFNDTHLRTDYNTAIAKAQMGDKWHQLQKYDVLEFRAVMDSKTSADHAKLDGTRLPREHPFWKKYWPPLRPNCRCTVIGAQGATINKQEEANLFSQSNSVPAYFKGNPGISGAVINEDEHPYFKKIESYRTGYAKSVELMAEENYAMPSVENIVKRKGLPELSLAQTKEEAAELWDKSNKSIKTADGVTFNMADNWDHVVDQHADDRWKYINHAKEVMEGADEVWLSKIKQNDGSTGTFKRYVKYYKGQPVVFSYPVDEPSSWTMYTADMESSGTYKKMRDNVRRGILIHRK